MGEGRGALHPAGNHVTCSCTSTYIYTGEIRSVSGAVSRWQQVARPLAQTHPEHRYKLWCVTRLFDHLFAYRICCTIIDIYTAEITSSNSRIQLHTAVTVLDLHRGAVYVTVRVTFDTFSFAPDIYQTQRSVSTTAQPSSFNQTSLPCSCTGKATKESW